MKPENKIQIIAESRTFLGDLQTPVGIYLKVRDLFPESVLLESSDYHTSENSYSFIGVEPIARFTVNGDTITEEFPDSKSVDLTIDKDHPLCDRMNDFLALFNVSGTPGRINGLFGYTSFDCVAHFENVQITKPQIDQVPQMAYIFFRYVITVNHMRNEMTVTENRPIDSPSGIDNMLSILNSKNYASYDFHTVGEITSPISDEQYMEMVRKGIGSDVRIGNRFLYAGIGYGGSCFPKDIKALIHTAHQNGYTMRILEAVEAVNEEQKSILFHKLSDYYQGDLKGKRMALWGLAFKPETDDMREAPSLILIDKLLAAGCEVYVYDPVSMTETRRRLGDAVHYAKDIYDAVVDADALLLVTEWKEFRMPSWSAVKKLMATPLILDGRNIYDAKELAENGFVYHCIGQ